MPRKGASSSAANSKTAQKESCCICCQPVTPGKDEALFCVGKCQQWLHRYCASVTIHQYKEINDNSEEFLCPTCCRERYREQISELTNSVSELKQEIVQLKESISNLSSSSQAESAAQSKQRSYKSAVQDAHGRDGRPRRRHAHRPGRAQAQVSHPPAKPTKDRESHPRSSEPVAKVVVEGARRLWGTRSETSSTAVRKAISSLCRGYNCSHLRIRRKTKVLANNRLSWWFVLHDSEESLKELENLWEPLRLQTDWKIESCLMPAPDHPPSTSPPNLTDPHAQQSSDSPSNCTNIVEPHANPAIVTDADHGAGSAAETECEPEQVTNLHPAQEAGEGDAGLERPLPHP